MIAIASMFFLGAATVALWYRPLMTSTRSQPVYLGTNELKVGAKLYDLHNRTNHIFTVLEVDPAYDFPGGDTRPGVRVNTPANSASSWVPRAGLNKTLVMQ